MIDPDQESFLSAIRRSLGRNTAEPPLPVGFHIPIPRQPGNQETEIALLVHEINALSGHARSLDRALLPSALEELVRAEEIYKAVLWPTPLIHQLNLEEHLKQLGVEVVPPSAGKSALSRCDLGVTEADYALPETGTLALLSSPEKPRVVSLLPRVHLAVLQPAALRSDLHQVFAEARNHPYLVLITGPSRTADIELTVTLGVHGPKDLYAWVIR